METVFFLPELTDSSVPVTPQRQQEQIIEDIRQTDTSQLVPGLSETELIQQLVSVAAHQLGRHSWDTDKVQVLQLLQHDGYVETAKAFVEELHAEKSALRFHTLQPVQGVSVRDDEDANNRQRIRRAVLEGDIDSAITHTNAHYPSVLRDNEQVYFHLRCRKFIEMIRKEAELNMQLEERRKNSENKAPAHRNGGEIDEEMMEAAAALTEGADDGDDMDMTAADDETGANGSGSDSAELSQLSQDALAFGMELRNEFKADPRRETSKQLDEIFSLIAYPNPLKVKEVAYLLDGAGRVTVAEELNSAILSMSFSSVISPFTR